MNLIESKILARALAYAIHTRTHHHYGWKNENEQSVHWLALHRSPFNGIHRSHRNNMRVVIIFTFFGAKLLPKMPYRVTREYVLRT